MTDYVNGAYTGWMNKYGRIKAEAFSEVKAYGWELSMSSPYFNNEMYINFLSLTK